MTLRRMRIAIAGVVFFLAAGLSAEAQNDLPTASAADEWFARVDQTQAEQPHWITPLVTVTPRLEEEFRFDFYDQQISAGATNQNFGGGKGLELIPARRVEIILGVPPYLKHSSDSSKNGWGDTNFLVKYRLFSSNEHGSNGIVTLFFGASAPTATHGNGSGHWAWTPTIAAGKGWRAWDVQSTFGVTIPSGGRQRLGTPLAWNTALQYHEHRLFWPEVEVNSIFFPNGARRGKKEIFLTPGLVIGKIRLAHRLGLTFGAGFQTAVTSFHTYNHAWIFTVRTPF
jgi:hypothetical protein